MNQTKTTHIAYIREVDCIGCTKCIEACPVDAIIGASKHMHTVLTDWCIGCKLCIPPCPMDCIELHTVPLVPKDVRLNRAQVARTRILERQARLERQRQHTERQYQIRKTAVIGDASEQLKALLERVGKPQDMTGKK